MEEYLSSILAAHPVLAPVLFIFLRAIPIVIPPIPGVPLDLVGVTMFGWKFGLFLALIGAHIGAAASFFIARYFRESAAKYFVPLQKLHDLEAKYSERKKFWALVGVRFITSPFFDYASYAAGLTKMSFWTFLFSTFIGVLPFAFAIYYFGNLALYQSPWFGVAFFIIVALVAGFVGKVASEKLWEHK